MDSTYFVCSMSVTPPPFPPIKDNRQPYVVTTPPLQRCKSQGEDERHVLRFFGGGSLASDITDDTKTN